MSQVLEIDGRILEGGGQILRNSISLSAILGVPVRVSMIRAGRSKPGLAAQHLKGIQLVAEMCKAKLKGAQIGSTEIEFWPGKLKGGHYIADIKTAGSISLLLQVSLPCALMADGPVSLTLKGGTNADMAPQVDYMVQVFLPTLNRFGADFHLNILRRGYFPRGGGHVTVDISPVRQLRAARLTQRGDVHRIQGSSFVAGTLPVKLAYQMSDGAKKELQDYQVSIECYKEDKDFAPDNCSGIMLTCETSSGCILGSDGLGKRNTDSHTLGADVARSLIKDINCAACLDTHAQDQVIIYMALASGPSSIRVGEVTLHTKTAIHIAELIAKTKFTIREEGKQNVIECTGIGYINEAVPA